MPPKKEKSKAKGPSIDLTEPGNIPASVSEGFSKVSLAIGLEAEATKKYAESLTCETLINTQLKPYHPIFVFFLTSTSSIPLKHIFFSLRNRSTSHAERKCSGPRSFNYRKPASRSWRNTRTLHG